MEAGVAMRWVQKVRWRSRPVDLEALYRRSGAEEVEMAIAVAGLEVADDDAWEVEVER